MELKREGRVDMKRILFREAGGGRKGGRVD
jgi:hypothetical protein